MTKLRFAPIIRVSTEKQEERGASLEVQRKQIISNVERLNGVIPDQLWQYSGQEHATPDFERKKLDQLLKDATKGIFDAVIVYEISRWSRDNQKSKQGLQILKDNGVRFFVGSTEYDLFNPEHAFILGMGAEVHELFARQQSFKSIMSKIEKSRQNIPAVGLLPYGRTFDHKTNTWGIDKEKQQKIILAAERYLSGESLLQVAETVGINYCSLHKTLKKFSGEKWTVRIKGKHFNIDEEITLTIPPLLSDETIKLLHLQMEANKTYRHGSGGERINKNRYLLGRMIFCTHCGGSLTGFANKSGLRYYKHYSDSRRPCKCQHTKFIHARELELAVLLHVVSVMGDPDKVQKAIKDANPDTDKLIALDKEQKDLQHQFKKLEKQKENVVDMIADGLISKDDVRVKMGKIKDTQAAVENRLQIIDNEIGNLPDPQRSKRLAALSQKIIYNSTKDNPKIIFKRSWEWQRNLLENVFAGYDSQGKRLGVYMKWDNDQWIYEIRGHCEGLIRGLPMDDDYLADMLKLDPDYCDITSELERLRANKREYFLYLQNRTSFIISSR